MLKRVVAIALLCVFALFAAGADALADGPISELRVGLLAHDVGIMSYNREPGADVNAEVLFNSPDWLEFLWSPRPHLGGSQNLAGNTSQVYAGLTWDLPLGGGFFVEGMLGGAVHDGWLNTDSDGRKSLGSRALFRVGGALGYALTEHVNVLLVFDHISNATLSNRNEGLDTTGVKVGWRF